MINFRLWKLNKERKVATLASLQHLISVSDERWITFHTYMLVFTCILVFTARIDLCAIFATLQTVSKRTNFTARIKNPNFFVTTALKVGSIFNIYL